MKEQKEQTRPKAIAHGYLIVNNRGLVFHNTFRSNRSWCWQAFIGKAHVTRQQLRKQGYLCVPIWAREY